MKSDGPCKVACGVPLFEQLLVEFSFAGCLLGLLGAWIVVKHRKAGSLGLLTGGFLPLVSSLILGPSTFWVFFSLWWSPLLILAGSLPLLGSRKMVGIGSP